MTCETRDFEGSWAGIFGERNGRQLQVVKDESVLEPSRSVHEQDKYSLLDGDVTVQENLRLDERNFTLKNESICLSLWRDCTRIFAIERAGLEEYSVWGAEREPSSKVEGSGHKNLEPQVIPVTPWIVRVTSGGPPVEEGSHVRIVPHEDSSQRAKIMDGKTCFDTLLLNAPNGTLDTDHETEPHNGDRCISLWDRGPSESDFIFSMVLLPEGFVAETLRGVPSGTLAAQENQDAIQEHLIRSGRPSFEAEALAHSFVHRHRTNDGGVPAGWGAEEGGG